jgi:hypothetical protein
MAIERGGFGEKMDVKIDYFSDKLDEGARTHRVYVNGETGTDETSSDEPPNAQSDGDHGFAYAEVSYGALCISKERERAGQESDHLADWYAAIERLKKIRAKQKGTGPKTCYMCDGPPTSVEHVPPRCLFPEKKDIDPDKDYRKNLITVPSCDIHNSEKSKDDEYLLAVLAAHFENNEPSKDHYGKKILRALQNSRGLTRRVLAGSEKVTLGVEPSLALRVDTEGFQRSLAHVACGLYYHTFGERCPHPVQIHTAALRGDGKQLRHDVAALVEGVRPLLGAAPVRGENPEIFRYRVVQVPHTPMTVMLVEFYQGVEVLALIGPGFQSSS